MTAATTRTDAPLTPVIKLATGRPGEASAEFRIGVGSLPYLADHVFQDMTVLPGSFYVEMALQMERSLTGRVPAMLRNVTFEAPVILSAGDTHLEAVVRELGGGRVEYTFHEMAAGAGRAGQHAARLEVDRNPQQPGAPCDDPIEALQSAAHEVLDAPRFYARLRENRNQYGPRFQNVSSIWRTERTCLAALAVPDAEGGCRHHLHPSLLDAMAQLLAPFVMERGRTFILRSIDSIEISDFDFPATLWARSELTADENGAGCRGNVRAFDGGGKPHVALSGIAFSLLDGVDPVEESVSATLVVASNFTAEPVDDCLRFWGDHFGVPIRTEYAPYNQVFQQLLDPGSAFHRNRQGANVVLLALEEWATGNRQHLSHPDRDTAARCFGERARCVLPNGLEVVHLNRYETEYLYQEIFEDECYLRHGITLEDGDTVVDIGANIGLFSLYVMSRCANVKIYAFEPAPLVHDLLAANCTAYEAGAGARAHALNLGVSDVKKTATFTFYEKSSVFSGFHSDEATDRDAIQAIVRNMLSRTAPDDASIDEYVAELTADRLTRKTQDCRLISVSDLIREHGIERIDLLKIDAEKSELSIISGIAAHDWPKINQLVIEIHDPSRQAVERIERLLVGKGFRCTVSQETLLEHSGLYNLYATRREPVAAAMSVAHEPAPGLRRNVEDFAAALRSFKAHSAAPFVLAFCPATPAALADPALAAVLTAAEETLAAQAAKVAGVRVIPSSAALLRYPLAAWHDAHTHQAGHIPYTPQCFAAIGTELVRALFNLRGNPYKVIVLDCDNTLWKGVCGEDGLHGIEITPGHRALQEFMLGQMRSGMVLALCSKNNERDALEVFDRHEDMVLKREHLVAWRINWGSKSENLRALARELNLGLDSFIFIDDSPLECAEVRSACPGVLVLQMPQDSAAVPTFLNHVWAFDRAATTEEDRNRTRMYQQSAERRRYRSRALSLKDFLAGLDLRIRIEDASPADLARISQLTFRTNQFNFTTVRRSEAEVRDYLAQGGRCLAVRVSDRFGDYGLTGVVMYDVRADRCHVDTFLLSCRVLGRGVEHAIVALLGEKALQAGREWIALTHARSDKNQPALEFLASLGDPDWSEGVVSLFGAGRLARVRYEPDEGTVVGDDLAEPKQDETASRQRAVAAFVLPPERLQPIAEALWDIERLHQSIEAIRLGADVLAPADATAGSPLETALAGIWKKVLGRSRIGLRDNFFEAGGNSLRAVQVIAMIKKELQHTLSIVNLFECPTVAALAARLAAGSAEPASEAAASGAAARGRQRRYNTMVRHAS